MQHRRRKLPIVLAFLALIVIGGGVFLMMAKIPAPAQPIEEALPADQFIKKDQ